MLRSFCLLALTQATQSLSWAGVQRAPGVAVGVVATAPSGEYNHFLRKASILVVEHSREGGTFGVNLESPTLLSIGEAAAGVVTGPLGDNILFMGGEHGGRGAVMIHGVPDLEGAVSLGGSGLYIGGIKDAAARVEAGDNDREDFKFFFNLCKFAPGELDAAVEEGRWDIYDRVPREVVLRQDPNADAGALWGEIRRNARKAAAANTS
mmetsp:Transcript_12194/g.36223  ORF Transcript_12194/g.36223 Transcript_12194/m.36223 type:complete len:208 (-) Transcript_12194:12-635(-)